MRCIHAINSRISSTYSVVTVSYSAMFDRLSYFKFGQKMSEPWVDGHPASLPALGYADAPTTTRPTGRCRYLSVEVGWSAGGTWLQYLSACLPQPHTGSAICAESAHSGSSERTQRRFRQIAEHQRIEPSIAAFPKNVRIHRLTKCDQSVHQSANMLFGR